MSKAIKPYAFFVFAVGAIFYFYDFVLQVSPSVMTQQLMHDFDANASVLGFSVGLYYVTYTLMQVPAGLLIEQFRIKVVLAITMICCAIGAILFADASNIYVIGLGRLLMGGGSAFAFLGTLYLALQWLPTRLFPLFSGITQTLGSLGAAGGIAPMKHMIHGLGWRVAMYILGLFGIVLTIITILSVSENDSPKQFKLKTQFKQMFCNFADAFKHRQTIPISVFGFCIWGPIVGFAALWGVKYLQTAFNFSSSKAGWGVTIIWLSMAVACPVVGLLSQAIKRRKPFLLICSLFGLLSTLDLLFNLNQPDWLIFTALFLIGVAGASQSLTFTLITDNQPSHLVSAAHGFNNMILVIGGFVFQSLIGFLLDCFWQHQIIHGHRVYSASTFQFALVILPILYAIAIIICILSIRETYCRIEHHNSKNR